MYVSHYYIHVQVMIQNIIVHDIHENIFKFQNACHIKQKLVEILV